jgi:hypothetical protein
MAGIFSRKMPEVNAAPVGYGSEVLVWSESSGKLEARK